MKKSLLAVAVIVAATSAANAATVYDKDGTKLYLDGRVQSVFYNGNHKKSVAEYDSTIKNSARFGIGGRTQITDWVAGYGYAQWDTSDGADKDKFEARDQFVGADFGNFGKVQAGKFRDSGYYVENLTNHYEDAADTVQGTYNGDRRNGQLMYIYDNYGFHAQAGIQTATDNAKLASGKYQVDSGANVGLGYKIDDVLFGPLEFRTSYTYLKGQKDYGDVNEADGTPFNKFKHANIGVAWGNLNSGLYLAAIYEYAKFTGLDREVTAAGEYINGGDESTVNKGFELAVGYAFDNGVSAMLGYETSYWKEKTTGENDVKYKYRRIPLLINYKLNSNFNVWTEFGFNAGSDHKKSNETVATFKHRYDKTVFSIGARYTF